MKNYIGIDVGKDWLDISMCINQNIETFKLSNSAQDILEWIERLDCPGSHVVLEATGSYHLRVCYLLDDAGVDMSILNPAVSAGFSKSLMSIAKTDSRDSRMLSAMEWCALAMNASPALAGLQAETGSARGSWSPSGHIALGNCSRRSLGFMRLRHGRIVRILPSHRSTAGFPSFRNRYPNWRGKS